MNPLLDGKLFELAERSEKFKLYVELFNLDSFKFYSTANHCFGVLCI